MRADRNPIGFTQKKEPYDGSSRSALRGPSFTGKLSAYERSLEVAKNLHMGYTDRKFGPGRPSPAR